MIRLAILVCFFLISLLCIFWIPFSSLWAFALQVTENSWKYAAAIVPFLIWGLGVKKYQLPGTIIGVFALILFLTPIIEASIISSHIEKKLEVAFCNYPEVKRRYDNDADPFSILKMVTNPLEEPVPFTSLDYFIINEDTLSLDYYSSLKPGLRPCVIVVHGGGWQAGYSNELPELNYRLARDGYNVASINYRLIPRYHYPAQMEDVHHAFEYLRGHATSLHIDTNNFVLLGRSAGGQIVLTAAYTLHEPGLKGVISYYGATDLEWWCRLPPKRWRINPLWTLKMYLGGTCQEIPEIYKINSAVSTVNLQSVPTLLIHGGNDPIIDYKNGVFLDKKLGFYHVKHYFLSLPWAIHGFDENLNSPSGQLSSYVSEKFLHEVTGMEE